ncbi:MAG: ABC transporter ATP-binding protein [Microthrixaceae bacterium]
MTVQSEMKTRIPLSQESPQRALWRYARGHRGHVVLGTTMSILNKAADIAPELLIGAAVDVVVNEQESFIGGIFGVEDRFQQLTILAIVTALVWIIESATEYVAVLTWRYLAQKIEHEMRMDLYSHVQGLDQAYFEEATSGGLMAVINDDVNQLERFLDMGIHKLLITAANVVFVGIVFFVISPLLTLLSFLPIPVIIAGSLWFQSRLEPLYAKVRAAAGNIADTLTNGLGGVATIRAFNAQQRDAERVGVDSADYERVNRDAIRMSTAFKPLIRTAVLVGFIMTLVVGGRMAIEGQLAIGLFSVLVYMTQRLLWPLTDLGETLDLYQRAMASCRRIFGLMEVRPTITDGSIVMPSPASGEIRFDGVEFSYASSNRPVLRGFDMHIPSGETHAIVGATGAGKSTVIKLLLRLYEPTGGSITLDGHDIENLTLESLRDSMGFVAQDVYLFQGSVRDNLALGRPEATDAEIMAAADLAEARDFIEAMPAGLDTIVGERGQKLSGGQRQRLTIARAILADPAILVLDEATSAVDNETEAAIQRSLQKVAVGRTTVVVAHRLSTIRHAHRIHVMDAGEVVESGTHEELVELGGLYAALWKVQTGEID